jgi:hypothetical protein
VLGLYTKVLKEKSPLDGLGGKERREATTGDVVIQ